MPKAADWYGKGNDLFDRGEVEEALKCYERAIEIDPRYGLAWRRIGGALHELRRFDEALGCYDKAIERNPKDAFAWHGKGSALRELRRFDEALGCYDKVIEIDPEDALSWCGKGDALFELRRFEEALRCYDKATEIDPKDAFAWRNKGVALFELRRFEEALGCYDKATEINPGYGLAWFFKGVALRKLRRFEEALRCHDKVIEIDPKDALSWCGKGDALFELRRFEEALRCYDKATEIDPEGAFSWRGKGSALRELRRFEEALGCYDKATEIDPKDAFAWRNKGVALRELRRFEEASTCLNKALEIDPTLDSARNEEKQVQEEMNKGAKTESNVQQPSLMPSEKAYQLPVGRVTVLRGGEVVSDEYVFKVKIMNDTPYNITNAVVALAAYPVDCLAGAPGFSELRRVNVIEAGGFASPSFAFKPTRDCVKGTIKAIVNYVDYRNELRTVKVEPHEISLVCGLLKPLVVEEKEFEKFIKDWIKTDGNIEVKGMNARDVFRKAQDMLEGNNFHIVTSHEVPVEGMFAGIIKGFAQGKYSEKRVGVALEIRGDIHGEDSFIKVVTSAEEAGMVAPAMQEVLDGLRKPRLFGKRSYYERLSELVLKAADEMFCDKGGIVTLADLCLAINAKEGHAKIPIDSVEEATKILCGKGLVGGIKKLSSGIKILEVKPLELSENLNMILNSVSGTGVTTKAELIKGTGLSKEVVETALEKLDQAGIAKRALEPGNVERWYFPAFYQSPVKQKQITAKDIEEFFELLKG